MKKIKSCCTTSFRFCDNNSRSRVHLSQHHYFKSQFTWKLVVPFPPRVFDWEFFFFPFLLNCIVVKFFSSWSVVSGSSAIELWTLSSFCPQSFFSSTESANYFMLFIILNFACHLKLKRMLSVRFTQLYFSPPHTVFLCTYSYISIFFVEVIKLYSI